MMNGNDNVRKNSIWKRLFNTICEAAERVKSLFYKQEEGAEFLHYELQEDDLPIPFEALDEHFDRVDRMLEEQEKEEAIQKEKEAGGDTLISTKGLPIYLTREGEPRDPLEELLKEQKRVVVYEFESVRMQIELESLSEGDRIPFEHLETECELIIDDEPIIVCDNGESCNVIFKRPDVYYRRETDSERFPCKCLCIVDDDTLRLFEGTKDWRKKTMQIETYSRLSKAQRKHICTMARRPKAEELDQGEVYTPIRDTDALKLMYKLCRDTYSPEVRARADMLLAEMDASGMSDKMDLINQLGFTIGIDTNTRPHPKRSYEEYMAILDKHIYGLRALKEEMVEFLMAMQYSGASYFVMLLVGPPGVGKTTICDGLAECMEVAKVHIDCSGVDINAMTGLVKSYGGAKAGKFMDGVLEKGHTDLLVLLDEIEKMSPTQNGDPYSALIKPLGPHRKFYDEYVANDLDVSATKFIATANDINQIPGYILSRFENCVFQIPAYTEDEKVEIAQKHLIPGKLSEYNLSTEEITFDEQAIRLIIRNFCDDEGARDLKGNITKLIRKAITERMRGIISFPLRIDATYVESHLRRNGQHVRKHKVGF